MALTLIYTSAIVLPKFLKSYCPNNQMLRNNQCKIALEKFFCIQQEYYECKNSCLSKEQIESCKTLIDQYRIYGTYNSPDWQSLINHYDKFQSVLEVLKD